MNHGPTSPPRPFPLARGRSSRLRALLIGLLFPFGATAGWAQEPAPVVGSTPADPAFSALLTDGSKEVGRLGALEPDGGLTLLGGPGGDRKVAGAQWVKLSREAEALPSAPANAAGGGMVLFPGVDRLSRCAIGQAGDASLGVRSPSLLNLDLPIDAMIGVVLAAPRDPAAAFALEARLRGDRPDAERLWLANGDKVDGLLAGVSADQVRLQTPNGIANLPRASIESIGFNPAQVVDKLPRQVVFEVTLLDGSRLTLWDARVDRGLIAGKARFGPEVRFPIGDVRQVRVLNAGVSYLSDREPDRAVYEAYVGPTQPYRRNAAIGGRSIQLGGQAYDRGLGTWSRTLLAYRLDGQSKRFQATVGLDDAAGPLGNVGFKVLVDGKTRFESPMMGAGTPPIAVSVDLLDAKLLILITEFGERGDVQDAADWAEARLVR